MKLFVKALCLATAGFSANLAFAENCKVEIEGNDQMKFNKTELTVDSSCKEIEVTLKHTGKFNKTIMGHNWVLFETKSSEAGIKAAEKAGAAKDYLPDAKLMVAGTKVIGGGESVTIKIPGKSVKKGGDYIFACTFPGHSSLMKGKFIVK